MKIWNSYGSEHSMNLVMIGRFEDSTSAADLKDTIDQLTKQVSKDMDDGLIQYGGRTDKYSDGMLFLLQKLKVHCIAPAELEQFAMDINSKTTGKEVVITTNEADVSAFLKLLVDKGARVDVFSAHFHKNTGFGR